MEYTNRCIEMVQVEQNKWNRQEAEIIVETPVSLTVNSEVWLTFMCTPVDLEALAIGFLFNEGLIDSINSVADVRLCPAGDNVDVWLNHPLENPKNWRRTSGCTGGMTTVSEPGDRKSHNDQSAPPNQWIRSSQVGKLMDLLFSAQGLYQRTGGVHTSVLSNGEKMILSAEDIGRHNTLDKLAGLCLLNNIRPLPEILLTSGRISSEMLQKAARMRVKVLISRTSPTSLSIQMAEKLGITVIGYAHRDRFRIYTHPERILLDGPEEPKESAAAGSAGGCSDSAASA